jgi:Asp-tRNA(Asn)/Glu-tRNA(Gln) amidotransferase C subunit
MLATLHSQLHFVNQIRAVDTSGVQPLQSLRDETEAGRRDAEIGMEELKEAFAEEDLKGSYLKRIRRRRTNEMSEKKTMGEEDWDVLGSAQKKVGRYFVVEGPKEG